MRNHYQENELPPEKVEQYAPFFQPGALWKVITHLEVFKLHHKVMPPPYPMLITHAPRDWDPGYNLEKEAVARPGTLALYAGHIRVEEKGKSGLLRIVRHTFIIGSGRYIMTDLNWVTPVGLE